MSFQRKHHDRRPRNQFWKSISDIRKYARFAIHIPVDCTEIGHIQLPDGIHFNFPKTVTQLLLVQIWQLKNFKFLIIIYQYKYWLLGYRLGIIAIVDVRRSKILFCHSTYVLLVNVIWHGWIEVILPKNHIEMFVYQRISSFRNLGLFKSYFHSGKLRPLWTFSKGLRHESQWRNLQNSRWR